MRLVAAPTLLVLLAAAACDYDPGGRCERAADCLDGQVCDDGVCAAPAAPRPNAAPSAGPDGYAVPASGEYVCAAPCLLANDADPDGDRLQAEGATPAAHGVVFVSPDGSFRYLASAGYSGGDSFTYRATDGALFSAPATVTLTVAAAP